MKNPFFDDDEQASSQGSSNNAVTLTTSMFYGANGWSPYFTQDEWLDYGKRLRPTEVDDLRKLISLMKAGFRMDGNHQTRKDKGKREYLYDHFIQSKARPGVKVVLEGGMLQFILDYQQGIITIDFTLEELVEEARKQV